MPITHNHAIWGALLGACVIHENVELREIAARWTFELEPENTGNYVLLAKLYAAVGRWRDAETVRDMVNEVGLRKLPAHSSVENLFLYGYGAMFNFLGIVGSAIVKGPNSFDILEGHSKATMLLIANNAAQGILSSFFFKYADTILKKYSSTVATIFTGIASAVLFGHKLTMNFLIGISIVFISMHQFFLPLAKVRYEQNSVLELSEVQEKQRSKLP